MMDAEEERNWAIACHLSSLAWIPLTMVGLAMPFTNLLVPGLIWYLKKNESEIIDAHGRESLNFQISMTIYGLVTGIMFAVIIFIGMILFLGVSAIQKDPIAALFAVLTGFGLVLAVFLLMAIAIFQLVIVIFAAVKAHEGELYRYPFNLRLL